MMFAKHPRLAKEWAAETPDFKSLPEKVKPMSKKADDGQFFEDRDIPQKGRFFRDMNGRDDGMFMGKTAQTPSAASSATTGAATSGSNKANAQAGQVKSDQTSQLNIGATGAPMGGSGFRGQGMGGGMYGTGDGEKTAAKSYEGVMSSKLTAPGAEPKPQAFGPQPTTAQREAADKPQPNYWGPTGGSPGTYRAVGTPKQVKSPESAPSSFGQYARDPDTGKLLNQGPPASAKPVDPYTTKAKTAPTGQRVPKVTVGKGTGEPMTPPATKPTAKATKAVNPTYNAPMSQADRKKWNEAENPPTTAKKAPRVVGKPAGKVSYNPNAPMSQADRKRWDEAENPPTAKQAPRVVGRKARDTQIATAKNLFAKKSSASPTDWDPDIALPVGFHRPAHEQPEALEEGGERFHSTESNSVVPSSNRQRHGLVEGGNMTLRATSSPQMGKHASVARFLGTSFGIEKSAWDSEPDYYKKKPESSGSWIGDRAGEFTSSLRKATGGAGKEVGEGVKSITTSPLAAVVATAIAARLGYGGLRRGVRALRGTKTVAQAAPAAKQGLIGKLVSGARGLVSGAKNYVTK